MAMPADEQMTQANQVAAPSLTSNMIVAPDATDTGAPSIGAPVVAPQPADGPTIGTDGEEVIWEGHYSFRNFLLRILFGALLTALWVMLVVEIWGLGHWNWEFAAILLGMAVLVFWVNLGFRLFRAHRSHHYRLTNRRLFITSGFFRRRVDQVELMRIKDLYVQQSMIGDWLGIGTVSIISSEASLPKAYLVGINDPGHTMDLIWHYTRLEQDMKTTKVDQV